MASLAGYGNVAGSASSSIICPTKAGPTPVNVWEYESYASTMLPRNAFDYYSSGANDMITLKENRQAFNRLRLRPRILHDVNVVDLSTTILGEKVEFPICLSPVAMQQMANPDGEVATARAAANMKTLMILSSWSTVCLEDVMQAAPQGLKWFQLYVYKDRVVTLDLIKRAEACGYKALAITVDTPVLGRREQDIRNQFALPSHLTMGNFSNKGGDHNKGATGKGGLSGYVASLIDKTLNWDDIEWVRRNTTMKIVLKGILTGEDADKACRLGVDGIMVSNHGARQLDTVPATIEVLKEVVDSVNDRCEVYLDGGVCRGTDAIKAIILGARAVFIGRPYLWGLSHSGQKGVEHVLSLLKDELTLAMRLIGCTNTNELKPSMLIHHHALMAKL